MLRRLKILKYTAEMNYWKVQLEFQRQENHKPYREKKITAKGSYFRIYIK